MTEFSRTKPDRQNCSGQKELQTDPLLEKRTFKEGRKRV